MQWSKSQIDGRLQEDLNFALDAQRDAELWRLRLVPILRAVLREELKSEFQELHGKLAVIMKPERLGQEQESGGPLAVAKLQSAANGMNFAMCPGMIAEAATDAPVSNPGLRQAGKSMSMSKVEQFADDLAINDLAVTDSTMADDGAPFILPDTGKPMTPTCWSAERLHTANGTPLPWCEEEHEDEQGTTSPMQSLRSYSSIDGNLKSSTSVGSVQCASQALEFPDTPTAFSEASGNSGKQARLNSMRGKPSKIRKNQTRMLLSKHDTENFRRRSPLYRWTSGKHYELLSGTLIVVNAAYIGWQTQHLAEYYRDCAMQQKDLGEAPLVFFLLHLMFTILFILELLPRWIAAGFVDFFNTDERWWNILDVIVVANGVVESILEIVERITTTSDLETGSVLQNISAMRLLRIIRVVRVVKVIRVMKFFRELRMMIYSILGSMKNLLWVMIILGVTFYLFGVAFTAAVTNNMETKDDWNNEDNAGLLEAFGTVDRSALTLYMSMSGGNDWSVYYTVLEALPKYYRWLFLLFISFTLFAIVNIVTGVFVEAAMQNNLHDRDIIAQEELQSKRKYLEAMQELFEEMDDDQQGTISMEEFEKKLQDERVIAFFNSIKLDVSDAHVLFRLIDIDKSGDVTIDEFVSGCYRLQGESRSLDMKIMQFEVTQLREMSADFSRMLQELRSCLLPS